MICNGEAASVEASNKQWAGKATFVGVAWNGDESSFTGFVAKHALTFAQIADPDGEVFARFNVPSQPAVAIVDAMGRVHVTLGKVEPDALDAAITAALGTTG